MKNIMVNLSVILCALLIFFAGAFIIKENYALAAEKMQTLTFAWEYTIGDVPVITWQMNWAPTQGGPYTKLADIPFANSSTGTWESPVQATVIGAPGTHETRYFTLLACGNVPQSDGSTIYECSTPSNEVSYDFWIEPSGFSAPVQFRVMAQ